MKKNFRIAIIASLLLLLLIVFAAKNNKASFPNFQTDFPQDNMGGEIASEPYSLSIEALRQGEYPGSDLVIEETLAPGSNYQRYIVSYRSEGLKIYGLLTVPNPSASSGQGTPVGGWPAIVFNHGYIPPREYQTTERYVAYTDAFSRSGYVLLRPDYRGHGNSEGNPTGAYGSNGYTIDALNALASLKKLNTSSLYSSSEEQSDESRSSRQARTIVNPERIGMWGHSMGGFITLRALVVRNDIKAGVIWAGVVASYQDLFERWRRRVVPSGTPSASGTPSITSTRGGSWRQALSTQFGTPEENPEFWNSLSANTFLSDISGPVQLHHGTVDTSVPVEFSEKLEQQLKTAGKTVELYTYDGDDHNIGGNFNIAAQRSVEFFDKYLK